VGYRASVARGRRFGVTVGSSPLPWRVRGWPATLSLLKSIVWHQRSSPGEDLGRRLSISGESQGCPLRDRWLPGQRDWAGSSTKQPPSRRSHKGAALGDRLEGTARLSVERIPFATARRREQAPPPAVEDRDGGAGFLGSGPRRHCGRPPSRFQATGRRGVSWISTAGTSEGGEGRGGPAPRSRRSRCR
jgi:hypothetical protein